MRQYFRSIANKQFVSFKIELKGMRIKGLFWPPLEPKTESCFSPISSYWFIKCKILAFIFLLPVAMVTKMAENIGLKLRNCHFRPNLRLLETDFFKIRYQHKQIPKNPFNILCAVIILIIC